MNPPGWYPSPERPGYMQYWDGIAWTPRMQSIAGLPPSPAPPGQYPPAGYSSTGPAPADFRRVRPGNLQGLPAAAFMVIFGLIFIGIGSLPLSLAVHDTFSSGPTVEGTVVDVRWSESRSSSSSGRSSSRTTTKCSPVSRFTLDGREYTVSSNVFTGSCKWNVGDPIEMVYDPANPQDARKKSSLTPTLAIFPVIGAVIAGLGVRSGLRELGSRRKGREQPAGY